MRGGDICFKNLQETFVDIRGIDKMKLLRRVWENQHVALFFNMHPHVPEPIWDDVLARKALKAGYIDYFQGRAIKMDLSKDTVDCSVFNLYRPKMQFEDIVKKCRV